MEEYKSCFGSVNAKVAKLYSSLGQCHARKGAELYTQAREEANNEEIKNQGAAFYGEAIEQYRKSIETYEFSSGQYSLGITSVLNAEGVIVGDMENPEKAIEVYRRAVQVIQGEKTLESYSETFQEEGEEAKRFSLEANINSNLGQALEAQGKKEEAIEAYQRVYDVTFQFLGPDNEKTIRRLNRLERLKEE